MTLLLLTLGCSSSGPAPKPLAIPSCEAWSARLPLGSERIVSCGERALALRIDGKVAEAQDAHFSKVLKDAGYVLERDVSRSRQIARVYEREGERVALSITESRDGTTVSFSVLK